MASYPYPCAEISRSILRSLITLASKRKVSLLGSQAVKLLSQGQIAVVGEDLQYFWQILISRHGEFALTRAQSPMLAHICTHFTFMNTVLCLVSCQSEKMDKCDPMQHLHTSVMYQIQKVTMWSTCQFQRKVRFCRMQPP